MTISFGNAMLICVIQGRRAKANEIADNSKGHGFSTHRPTLDAIYAAHHRVCTSACWYNEFGDGLRQYLRCG